MTSWQIGCLHPQSRFQASCHERVPKKQGQRAIENQGLIIWKDLGRFCILRFLRHIPVRNPKQQRVYQKPQTVTERPRGKEQPEAGAPIKVATTKLRLWPRGWNLGICTASNSSCESSPNFKNLKMLETPAGTPAVTDILQADSQCTKQPAP